MPEYNTEYHWMTVIAYAWLFCSVVAGVVTGIQYLYSHLRWIA